MSSSNDFIQIGNEFTVIHVRKLKTNNGEFLEIDSKKSDQKIRLDAMQLESLSLLEPHHFSEFFEIKFGIKDLVNKKITREE